MHNIIDLASPMAVLIGQIATRESKVLRRGIAH
jgi:hypothetical protein